MNKAIKFNSSTTLNSTSIEYNSINVKENINKKSNKNKNKNNNKNEKINKKNNEGIFEKEYKKIIEYNKKKKNLSQNKNYGNKNHRTDLENNYENDLRSLYAEIQNKTSRFPEYNGTSPTGMKEDFHQKIGDRKLYVIGNNNYKKNNFIPTTNYTNSESPGNTRLITFQGRGPGTMPRLKKKYKE